MSVSTFKTADILYLLLQQEMNFVDFVEWDETKVNNIFSTNYSVVDITSEC
jgi:uncharacterized protein YuzE